MSAKIDRSAAVTLLEECERLMALLDERRAGVHRLVSTDKIARDLRAATDSLIQAGRRRVQPYFDRDLSDCRYFLERAAKALDAEMSQHKRPKGCICFLLAENSRPGQTVPVVANFFCALHGFVVANRRR